MARPPYEATRHQQNTEWTEAMNKAFNDLKQALLSALALRSPDLTKPFYLYVDEKDGVAKGVLVQYIGPWKRPIAYLSKKLDTVATGWPPCLKIIATVATMVKDTDKLAMGQELYVTTPHAIEWVFKQPPDRWISNAHLTHYQSLLLNPTRILFKPPTTLNLATLLPNPDWDPPLCITIKRFWHRCMESGPLPNADATWYTDGSSFVREGIRYAGAAVTTKTEIIWAEPLAAGTSAQRAELIALAEALTMGEDKRINIYTDSRYAFATAHIHGALYRERGLLTAEGKT
ncbi:uncharacterized protein LOC123576824 isoform X2 [Leopardus geoffroyi]|nr:uncharacterized protein LOC123576824 isoform X2 [Leopardus geoffroyi]